jgi:hypothetical protein
MTNKNPKGFFKEDEKLLRWNVDFLRNNFKDNMTHRKQIVKNTTL